MRPVRKADNLTTILRRVKKSGNFNFLEPSGPLQACNGTALPFTPLVAAVQYTFTHKQYTEQHNETQYTSQNIHNSKST
jgi:hypothetical protein